MQQPIRRACFGNPEICLKCTQGKNKIKRLATRDTLHGSRPNLRQRDPDGRIVPIPSDVSDRGASTSRDAPYDFFFLQLYVHIQVLPSEVKIYKEAEMLQGENKK